MKIKIILIISVLLLVLFSLLFGKFFACRRLSCISMNDLNNFKIKDIYQENNNTFRALYTDKDKILRVEVMSQVDQFTSNQFINASIAQIKGIFTDSLAPYPGVASNTITCDAKYQPFFNKIVTSDKLEVSYFIAYLNSNLTYGSCTEDQTTYKGLSVYFYCSKNKQTYHLEIIVPKKDLESSANDYKDSINSIKCN